MRKLILIGMVAALSGCASDLRNINDSLRQANGALAGRGSVASSSTSSASMKLGDDTGYQPTIMVETPAGLCDMIAFNDGVKVGYITGWNQQVRDRALMHRLAAQSNPKDARLQANAQLFKNKLISTAALPLESNYQMQVKMGTNNCKYDSFTQGKTGGQRVSIKDYQALQSMEVR